VLLGRARVVPVATGATRQVIEFVQNLFFLTTVEIGDGPPDL
jgi:hypothetical protein